MSEVVVFLGMGGTIAGTAKTAGDNVGYTAAQVGVDQLIESVPGLQRALGNCKAQSEQVCQIDSKDLRDDDWMALTRRVLHHLQQPQVRGVVVTHGTDTLEETAYWLSAVLPAELLGAKPVLLTCAMRPASSLTPDGPGNMADAATVACHPGARGVVVVCAGKIHSALTVQKVHPYRVDAFDSGEAGPLGLVEEGSVRMLSDWPNALFPERKAAVEQVLGASLPRVEILLNHAGAGGAMVRSLLKTQPGDAPLRGLVVAGTGNGTAHRDLQSALVQAHAQGVRVVRVSRCAYGQVVGTVSRDATHWEAMPLSAVKARIALILELLASS